MVNAGSQEQWSSRAVSTAAEPKSLHLIGETERGFILLNNSLLVFVVNKSLLTFVRCFDAPCTDYAKHEQFLALFLSIFRRHRL